MRIGEQIKNYRKTAGLTQEQVANYLGVSTPAVNKWEKGNTYPDISLLPALARHDKVLCRRHRRQRQEHLHLLRKVFPA